MSALINQYFKKAQLELMLSQCDDKGVSITSSINDDTNEYSQNIASWISQSKEQREAKEKRVFVSNGNVVYTENGVIKKAVKSEPKTAELVNDNLPF